MGRAERVVEQLGMSHGAAAGQLRKRIMFWLLEELNRLTCSKCFNPILDVKDLSVEHIHPWENRDPKLFWDKNNIAFSHMKCNQPHVRNGSGPHRRTRLLVDGKWRCSTCKLYKEPNAYGKDNSSWSKVQYECKDCKNKYKDKIRRVDRTAIVPALNTGEG